MVIGTKNFLSIAATATDVAFFANVRAVSSITLFA